MTTVKLPPGPSTPAVVQLIHALTNPLRGIPRLRERYGDAVTINHLVFGRTVVISDAAEIRQLFQTSPDIVDNIQPNLGRVLGPGSMFALRGEEHRRQRRLLVPPFHGRRLAAYERIVEDETVRELATWPQDRPFATMPSMARITLGVILRAVFGCPPPAGRRSDKLRGWQPPAGRRSDKLRGWQPPAGRRSDKLRGWQGAEFEQLRALLPPMVALGSKLALLPIPRIDLGRFSPWGRFWAMRRRYDAIVGSLLERAQREDLDEREDILAMMLQSRYDDGSTMGRGEIADQLLTLLTAGHETTATTLAWAVERLRRHPGVLDALVDEVERGEDALRQATLVEVQRTRPVIDIVGRRVKADHFELGRWILPQGCTILVSIALLHVDGSVFPDPETFDPYRFLDAKPDLYQWIPFGGGTRRCLGAAFATMEMNVVLRTMLRDFTLLPTDEPAERWHSRGVAYAPAKGGMAVVRPRAVPPARVTAVGGLDAAAR